MQLNDLMVLCIKLQAHVLDLEKAKDTQAKEIAALKKRVQRLEREKKSRTTSLRRLKKVGMYRRVESSEDQESLERQGDDLMFDTGVLDDDEVFVDVTTVEKEEQSTKTSEAVTTAGVKDSVTPTIPTTIEETLDQTLMEIKAAKPKAKGIVFHDQEEQVSVSKPTVSVTQPLVKYKGKGIIQKPERPLKRKEQVSLDEQMARDIQAQLDSKIIEEERLERQKQEEANIALIKSWENTQAMMEADRLLVERLQTREREELTDEEKRKLFMELMKKRRKHFVELSAQEKRNRPPTKAHKRTQMSTYLKHIESNEKKEEGSEEKAKGSRKKMLGRKRAGKEQQQESSKKQRMEEDKETYEVEEVKEDDEAELKKHLVIKKDDDIAIDVIPLATRLQVIVDYKLHKEGLMAHYELIRADRTSKR
ncbi:hypothetical protein Tco_1232287, partial [Tanacetum coccineum]